MKKILFLASLSSLIFLFGCSNQWQNCVNSMFENRSIFSTCLNDCGENFQCSEICLKKANEEKPIISECENATVACTKAGFTWDYREQCVLCQLEKDTKNCDMFK